MNGFDHSMASNLSEGRPMSGFVGGNDGHQGIIGSPLCMQPKCYSKIVTVGGGELLSPKLTSFSLV